MVRLTIILACTLFGGCAAEQNNDITLSSDMSMLSPPSEMSDMGPIIGAPSRQDFGTTSQVATAPDMEASTPDQTMVEDMAQMNDGGAACQDMCLSNEITWGKVGGRTPYNTVYSLSPCRSLAVYIETPFANNPDDNRCERSLDPCNESDAQLIESLAMYLETEAVRDALRGSVFFGVDGRVFDGQVLSIRVGDEEMIIGDPCDGGADNCLMPPIDIQEMADLLWDAGRQMETAEPACANIGEDL